MEKCSCDFKINFDTIDKVPNEQLQNMIFKNIIGAHRKASNLEHPDSLQYILRVAYSDLCVRIPMFTDSS